MTEPIVCDAVRPKLDDHVEGSLRRVEADEVERHLAACSSCRAEVEALRSILAEAGALPRSIEPGHDLWPAIAARIRELPPEGEAAAPAAGTRGRARVVPMTWPWLAAAGIALVVLSSALTALVLRGPGEPRDRVAQGVPAAEEIGVGTPPELAALERTYVRATDELLVALRRERGDLSPATVALIEDNLRVIDHAIRESRAALARDPGNDELTRMLESAYEQKLELLRQATRLAAAT